jgi:hypothetical protein
MAQREFARGSAPRNAPRVELVGSPCNEGATDRTDRLAPNASTVSKLWLNANTAKTGTRNEVVPNVFN